MEEPILTQLRDKLRSVEEENRSLRIKIAGVDTLSSLLNGTRDELDTVFAEKENLEIEVSTLQCRCSILENDLAKLKAISSSEGSKSSKDRFEAILKENKQLKNELKQVKKAKPPTAEGMFDPETMFQLLAFKGEVEMEIKNIQKVMTIQEDESQITQISRLVGQVAKLEHQLSSKEEECSCLRSELDLLNQKKALKLTKDASVQCLEHVVDVKLNTDVGVSSVDAEVQTDSTRDGRKNPAEEMVEKHETTTQLPLTPKRSSSLKRRNSKRASGDWANLRKSHSDLFEDSWNIDTINPAENLKITQDLLVQANEIILTMTEENDKLLKVNAVLLEELNKVPDVGGADKESSVKERLKFLFSEISLEDDVLVDNESIQEFLLSSNNNGITKENVQEDPKHDTPKTSNPQELVVVKNTENCSSSLSTETITKNARDSGVDIFTLEPSSPSPNGSSSVVVENKECQTDETGNDENGNSLNMTEENDNLKLCLSNEGKKLTDAEEKISELQKRILLLEEKEKSVENGNSLNIAKENDSLKLCLSNESKKLTEAEEKISELQRRILLLEEKEKSFTKQTILTTRPDGKRLCKSVNNIPSSIQLPVTYQRIVYESDI